MKNTIILILLALALPSGAQTLTADWTFNSGDRGYYSYIVKTTQDDSGNIYNIGYYAGTVDFDPSANKYELTSDVDVDQGYVFIQKLSPNKELVWVRSLGNKNSYIDINSADMDSDGNIYLAGGYGGTLFIGSGLSAIHPHRGEVDCFAAKYDRNGSLQWGKSFGTDKSEDIDEIKVKSGRLLLIGNYEKELDVDWNASQTLLTPNEDQETFTAVYSLDGTLQWAKTLEGAVSNASSITEDTEGNVIISGNFYNPNNNDIRDVFVYKYSGTGLFRWFKTLKTNTYAISTDLHTRPNGDIIISGMYSGTMDCNPRVDVSVNQTSNGGQDYFLVGLDQDGDYLWNQNFGSKGQENNLKVEVSSSGEIFLAGRYNGTIDFNQGIGSAISSPTNDFALFIMKLNTQNELQYVYSYDGIVSVNSICNVGQTVFLGGSINTDIDFRNGVTTNYSLSDGHFLSTIFTECNIDTKLKNAANILETEAAGTYQWLDCSNGFIPIANATASIYTATQDGSYAVQITDGNCVDTSECIVLRKVDVPNLSLADIRIYPNPTRGHFRITLPQASSGTLHIYDQQGKEIHSQQLVNSHTADVQMDAKPGIYTVHCTSSKGVYTSRLLIQP